MSTNRVIGSVDIGVISRAGQKIVLEAALETEHWTRPESVINKPRLLDLMQKNATPLSKDTAKAIVR